MGLKIIGVLTKAMEGAGATSVRHSYTGNGHLRFDYTAPDGSKHVLFTAKTTGDNRSILNAIGRVKRTIRLATRVDG